MDSGGLADECLTPDVAAAYAAGKLSNRELTSVEDHIDGCSTCRILLSRTAELMPARSVEADVGSSAPSQRLVPGATVSRYQVDALLGAGGMGIVYSALDPDLGRRVALKAIRSSRFRGDSSAKDLLRREAIAMARLTHPNVVGIYDLFEADGQLFVVMEFVEGSTLRAYLASAPRSWREIIRMFLLAGKGLAAAHAKGIVHRDFKPENVLVSSSGRVCVSDFGLSRVLAEIDTEGTPTSEHVADGATSLPHGGTPRYMAPEQRGGKLVTPKSDQFSFAVALYEALHGEPPLSTEGRPRSKRPGEPIPRWLSACVQRALQPNPNDRYGSMEELLTALTKDPVAKRRRIAAALVVGAVVALVGVGQARARIARHQVCAHPERHLAGLWDPQRRQHVAEAFDAEPYSQVAKAAIVDALDEYAHHWMAASSRTCEAALARVEPSAIAAEPQMQCLDERLQELQATVDALGAVHTAGDSAKALVAVSTLTPVSTCDRERERNVHARRWSSPGDLSAVASIRADLARARVSTCFGQRVDAANLALQAKERAETLGDPELLTLSLLSAAEAHVHSAPDLAVRELHDALAAAEINGNDDDRGYALAKLIFLDGYVRSEWALASLWHEEGLAIVRRLGGAPKLEATIRNHYGVVLNQKGDYEPARVELERSVALFDEMNDSINVASSLDNLAGAYRGLGDVESAIRSYERALTTNERLLGASHPNCGIVLNNMANMFLEQTEFDRAVETSQRAIAIYDGVGMVDDLNTEEPIETKGEALLEAARYDAALPLLLRSHAIEEASKASTRWQVETLADLGRARLGLGELDEAVTILEPVVAADVGEASYLADAKFGLAQALHALHRDPKRARELAIAALKCLDSIRKLTPLRSRKRVEIEAFIARDDSRP